MVLKECKRRMLPSAPLLTFTLTSSMPFWCGSLICRMVRILVLPSGSIIAYAGHRFWPVNSSKGFLDKISTFLMVLRGVGSMEVFLLSSMRVCTFSMGVIWIFSMEVIPMVFKGIWLYAVGTLGHRFTSRPWMRWFTLAFTSFGSALGSLVPISWLFGPTTCTEMVFITTLVTFLAPCWAFSRQVRHNAFATYLPGATLGSWAITFLKFEGSDLIYGGCHCNSSIGLVSVEVPDCCLMLFGIL